MHTRHVWNGVLALAMATSLASCGSSGGGGTSSSGGSTPTTPSGGGGTPTATTTITITSSGVTPSSITVSPGSRVTFVNNDSRTHEMNSDPHPEHTDCQAINDVGFMTAGQTKTTGNLNTVRTCSYHDHNDPFNRNLLGTIRIQ